MPRRESFLIFVLSSALVLLSTSPAVATKSVDALRKISNDSPKICHSLEAEVRVWRGSDSNPESYAVSKNDVARALELMAVCKTLPLEPSLQTIVLIGKSVTEHKPSAEPLIESLIDSECINQCTDIAMALANLPQARSEKIIKTRVQDYLMKPKYPSLLFPQKHHELIVHGTKKGLWKLSKEDQSKLDAISQDLKKAEAEFHPAQSQVKDSRGNVIPMKHPKILEELQAAIKFQEKQQEISKRLK